MQALLPSNSSLLNTSSFSLSASTWLEPGQSSLFSTQPIRHAYENMIFSPFVPISDIHKICKWMNLPNFGKYVQIIFCLCMYSWNFKLWTFCMGTLYGNFVLLICVSILCESLICVKALYGHSMWLLCEDFVSILYWFCVFYTWIH